MKLNLVKNLDKLRDDAISEIDASTAGRIAELHQFQAVYQVKLAEARAILFDDGHIDTPYLREEAKLRGVRVEDLARLVKEKSDIATKAVFDLEMARQQAKIAIRSARTPAEIEAVKNRLKG